MTTERRIERKAFTMVPDWLVESDLSLHDYVVLLVLMKHGRTTGRCTPGFAVIARQARVSRDTVMRSLRSLEERGLIEIERRRVGTKNLSNEYRLHVDRARVVAPSDHSEGGRSQHLVAHSDQGWSLPATLTKPINESHERDTAASSESSSDVVSAIESQHAPGAIVLDMADVFDRVWVEWPKKSAKKTARAKFEIAAGRHPRGIDGLAADVIAHGRAHRAHTPEQFVPMLSTWLTGDRWEDSLPTPRRGDTATDRNAAIFARYLGPDGDAA